MFWVLCRMGCLVWCRRKLPHRASHLRRNSVQCQSTTFGAYQYSDSTSTHFGHQPRFYAMALVVSFAPLSFERFSDPCRGFLLHACIGVAPGKEDSQMGSAVWSGVGARKAAFEASRKQSTPPILFAPCSGIHSTSGRSCKILFCKIIFCRNGRSLLCAAWFSVVAHLGFELILEEPQQMARATTHLRVYRASRWEAANQSMWVCIPADSQARLLVADSFQIHWFDMGGASGSLNCRAIKGLC